MLVLMVLQNASFHVLLDEQIPKRMHAITGHWLGLFFRAGGAAGVIE